MYYNFKSVKWGLLILTGQFIKLKFLASHSTCYSKILTFVIIFLFPIYSYAFALLSHEAIIDNNWKKSIQPLLKIKYPRSSDSAIQVAHSYAFGGAIISDIGYYPTGSIFFTHLLHYVYTGDFVNELIKESKDVNEYAFALGVLSHYYTDKYGHPLCTNLAVPMLFPELKQEFGKSMTFEQNETAHSRVEYGFDVIQTAIGNYKPESYHSFIGFQISQALLKRAFLKIYKIELHEIFTSLPMAIEVFRFTVDNIIPELTRDAWRIRKSIISELNPFEEKDNYEYKINEDAYEKEFGTIPVKGIVLSFLFGLIPKIGPLAIFAFKEPSPEVQKLFKQTMKTISLNYSRHLKRLAHSIPHLDNINLDTGKKTVPKDYKLADEAYEELLKRQKDK
jgi:hypothetical protein